MKRWTNPFVKDAAMVTQVEASEPFFTGYTVLPEGVFADYSREITYSDGMQRRELWERRPSGFMRDSQGTCYTQYDPPSKEKWGARVFYPGIVEASQKVHRR